MRGLLVRTGLAFALVGCGSTVDVEALFPTDSTAAGDAARPGPDASPSEPDWPDAENQVATGGSGGEAGNLAESAGSGGTSGGVTRDDGGADATRGEGGSGGALVEASVLDARSDGRVVSAEAGDTADAASRPKLIRCGAAQCDATAEICCTESDDWRCLKKSQASDCPKYVTRLSCDERTDCPTGQACCLTFLAVENRDDASCASSCPTLPLCDAARSNQCANGMTCTGKSVVETYLYCR